MEKYIVALDFGSSKIACVAAQKLEYGVRILTYRVAESSGVTKGEISNIKQAIEIAKNLLAQTANEIDADITNVVVGISGQYIKTIDATNEKVRKEPESLISEEEIKELTDEMKNYKLDNEEHIIHVIPQCYNVDDIMGETEPVGMTGEKIQAVYKLVVGKNRVARNLSTTLSMTGIKPDLISFNGIASSNAILTDDEREVGVATVDIGGGTTEITIIKDNVIKYCKTIPFGGNSVTEDIRRAFGVSYKNAEQLKTQLGSCFSDLISDTKSVAVKNGNLIKQIKLKSISLVIEARMVEILQAVDYEINRSGLAEEIPSGILFTGGGATIMHLANLGKQMFRQDVRIANPLNIVKDSSEDAFNFEASTVVGLALTAIDSELDIYCDKDSRKTEEKKKELEKETEQQNEKDSQKDGESGQGSGITIQVEEDRPEPKPKKRSWKTILTEIFDAPNDEEIV